MTRLAEDLHNVSETVHQLDPLFMDDEGYGEVKSPQRHVRTRLYFTSESHVHALVNTLAHFRGAPAAAGAAQGPSPPAPAPHAEAPAPPSPPPPAEAPPPPPQLVAPLLSDDARAMLDATPELDYMTHIVFRLYENFQFPPGHERRHRLEILFSPGASFDPVTGRPRHPRVPTQLPPAMEETCVAAAHRTRARTALGSSGSGSGSGSGASPPAPATAPLPSPLPAPAPAPAPAAPRDSPLSSDSPRSGSPTSSLDSARVRAAGGAPGAGGAKLLHAGGDLSLAGPPAIPLSALAVGHALPVAGLLPLSLSITLEDFEEFMAEAIFAGGAAAEEHAAEQNPRAEARARTAAAVERIKKQRAQGYFLQ